MIVTCERCETKFQLDDARVPATGARVRCSKCKHAFLVLPPDSSGEKTVHAFALDAAVRGAPTPVGVAEDPETAAQPEEAAPDAGGSAETEDHDWQFAEQERPGPPPAPRRAKEVPEADLWNDVLAEEKPPEAMDLDALGSPDSWSFVSEDGPPVRPARSTPAAAPAAAAPTAIGRIRLVAAPRSADAAVPEVPLAIPPASPLLERAGWALAALLLLGIVHGIAWEGPTPPALARSFALPGGLVVEELELRRLQNLAAGPVMVVAGVLTNPGSGEATPPARLRARLVGPAGVALGEAAPPRGPEALRERPPEEGVPGEGLLAAPLAPGVRIPFEAVIERPPRGEARLELLLEPADGRAATDAPSPPRPLPSSG